MRSQCIDEGTIQSYLDGELSPNLMEKTAAHLAACDDCALALSYAQDELDVLSVALEPEMSLLPVPSERLRERINFAVAETQSQSFTEPKTSRFSEWFSTLTSAFIFKPQFAAGFAVVAFAILLGAFFIYSNKSNDGFNAGIDGNNDVNFPNIVVPNKPLRDKPYPTPEKPEPVAGNKATKKHVIVNGPTAPKEATLPGEKSYLQAIASLEKAIDAQEDLNMRPTLRAEYERNLAVVDKAIDETKKQVRQNPKDAGAAQLLFASYQSKIDLLNAVSNQNQLYASLRDD